MALNCEHKVELIKGNQRHNKDSGSVEVQVVLLTERIKNMTGHFSQFSKDLHSKIGLQQMVNKRKKLLRYLKKTDVDSYSKLINKLELRDSY